MSTLLVIDDDAAVLEVFRRLLQEPDLTILTASSAEEGLELLRSSDPDTVVLDVMLPEGSGLETFERIHRFDAQIPILMISASSDSDTVIEATKLGAFDYLIKPLDFQHVRELVQRALEIRRLTHLPVTMPDNGGDALRAASDVLIGRCPAMQEVFKAIGRIAAQNDTVLIRGESGTGKELIARAIYQHSPRKTGRFLAVNCAAIPETLLESELFGHERGAFTGAESRRIGKFEQCSGGTLLLDEIAFGGQGNDPYGCPDHRRHESRFGADGCRWSISARSLLSSERLHDPFTAAARSRRRYSGSGPALSGSL
jgi:DNA-binding NtrC family response regulator